MGGVEAEEHQWPWTVALFVDGAWFCGGSLLSSSYVLTAAHCVDGATFIEVWYGMVRYGLWTGMVLLMLLTLLTLIADDTLWS